MGSGINRHLLYAQVVNRREGGRVVAVNTRVAFGTPEAVAACLAPSPVSRTVNTSFVERDNLTQRQRNRRLTRRTNGFSKAVVVNIDVTSSYPICSRFSGYSMTWAAGLSQTSVTGSQLRIVPLQRFGWCALACS